EQHGGERPGPLRPDPFLQDCRADPLEPADEGHAAAVDVGTDGAEQARKAAERRGRTGSGPGQDRDGREDTVRLPDAGAGREGRGMAVAEESVEGDLAAVVDRCAQLGGADAGEVAEAVEARDCEAWCGTAGPRDNGEMERWAASLPIQARGRREE